MDSIGDKGDIRTGIIPGKFPKLSPKEKNGSSSKQTIGHGNRIPRNNNRDHPVEAGNLTLLVWSD